MKKVKKIILIFLASLIIAAPGFAQNEVTTPYQRQNQLEIERRLLRQERRIIDLENEVAGILPMANGGTATAMTAPSVDSSVYYDKSAEGWAFEPGTIKELPEFITKDDFLLSSPSSTYALSHEETYANVGFDTTSATRETWILCKTNTVTKADVWGDVPVYSSATVDSFGDDGGKTGWFVNDILDHENDGIFITPLEDGDVVKIYVWQNAGSGADQYELTGHGFYWGIAGDSTSELAEEWDLDTELSF